MPIPPVLAHRGDVFRNKYIASMFLWYNSFMTWDIYEDRIICKIQKEIKDMPMSLEVPEVKRVVRKVQEIVAADHTFYLNNVQIIEPEKGKFKVLIDLKEKEMQGTRN